MSEAREENRHGVEEERLEKIGQLVDEYLRRRNDGDTVDLDEMLRREDPDVTRAVREQLDFLGCLDSIYGDRGDSLDTTRLLGDFRILREVGRGGMGLVYEAEQISLGRRVALKVLPLAGILDSRQLERFRNEARAAAQLRHNHIVPIFAVGRERGVHYYAMQFIDGRSLQEVLVDLERNSGGAGVDASRFLDGSGRQSPLDAAPSGSSAGSGRPETDAGNSSLRSLTYWRSVVRLTLQAASALGYAHEVGIVHRDVKPANLLVDAEGHLWVTDFGLAQFHESTGLTLSGELVGTLSYMSPEQTEGQRALVDQRTDIYSLGATLYELLTLELPFRSSSRMDLIHKIRSEEPRLPRAIHPRLPVDYETVVLKAIQKDPAGRYRTMAEFAADLDALLHDQPIRARRVTKAERAWRWCRRNRAVATLGTVTVVLLLVVLVALGVVATIRGSRDLARRAEGRALISEALSRSRALRLDSGTGRKDQAMELLGQVASEIDRLELDPADDRRAVLELRGELVAWSSSYSARVDGSWEPVGKAPDRVDRTFELCPDFEHYAVNNEAGWVDIYPMASNRRVARVGGAKPHETRIFFSPSGRYLGLYYLEAGGRSSLEVWDWREEQLLLRDPSPHVVHAERFGPGDVLFAVRAEDGAHWIVRYDVAAGEAVARWRAPGRVWKLAVHPDGGRVVVTDLDSYHLLDLPATSGPGHLDPDATLVPRVSDVSRLPGPWRIMDLDWSPDGRRIAFATNGGEILALDPGTRGLIYTARGHQNSAMSVRFNRRGDLLASSSWDGTTRFYQAHTGEELLVLEGPSYNSFTFSRDDLRIGCAHPDRSRHCWRVEPPRILRSLRWRSPGTPAKEGSADVRVSEDGRFLASAHVNAGLRLWDLRRGTILGHVNVGSINRLHFDPSARSLVAFGAGGAQRWPLVESSPGRWRLGPPRPVSFLPPRLGETCGEVDATLRYCAAFDDTHLICVDRETGTLQRFPRPIINTAVSSRGLVMLDKTNIGEVWIASIRSGKTLARIASSGSAATRFSPDGRWAVVASYRDLRVFDTEPVHQADSNPEDAVLAPRPVFRMEKGRDAARVFTVAFSPDGRLLAAVVEGRRIRVFAVPTWERQFDIESPDSGQFRTFRFSPDGRLLVSSASNNALHVWRLDELVTMLEEYGVGIGWRPQGPTAALPAEAEEALELEVLFGIENDLPGLRDAPSSDLLPRYDRAIGETPSDPELFRQRALWHEHQGNREAALEDFRRAAELSPDSGNYTIELSERLEGEPTGGAK